MMENIKEIPYGIANFVEVAEQNMYYVDKTMYLPLLEKQPRNLFFIRPRRFGKSIFLSMLRAYYDIAQKEKFQKRFGNLWIGSRPTPLQGKFQVVYLDFSRASGGSGSLEENFNNYCGMVMDLFGKVYEPYYFPGFAQKMEEQPDFVSKLNYLNLHAAESGMRLYLIIDEYDNFTNIVLNEQGKDIYHALTHAYKENSSVRSAMEGERNIQGFFTAYLSVNAYYLMAPEMELSHGYCDLFLMPDLMRYEVKHSYILELKYLSVKDTEEKARTQWQEAVKQINEYAAAPRVWQLVQNTKLHCIIIQFRGWELERMEEV